MQFNSDYCNGKKEGAVNAALADRLKVGQAGLGGRQCGWGQGRVGWVDRVG